MYLIPSPRSLIPSSPDPCSLIPDPCSLIPDPFSPIPDPSHKGFTLVELLVVIAIIAILAGVLFASFGGTSESARAASCINNLRGLVQAANAHAMRTGYYPLAGSVDYVVSQNGKLHHHERPGWVSWLSRGLYGTESPGSSQYDDGNTTTEYPTKCPGAKMCPYFGAGGETDNLWALENGAIWREVSRQAGIFVCPTHRIKCQKNNGGAPVFSYVMNAKFGYDLTKGSGDVGLEKAALGVSYGGLQKADRMLMFAEIYDGTDETSGGTNPSENPFYDCVLNYRATINGKKYGSWDGTPEQIGFPHKGPRGKKIAHVAFADGHTEKLTEGGGGMKMEDLTALLCEGRSYSFNGSAYQPFTDED